MGHRDSLYRLSGTIEIDDAFVGGKQKGKRGRGASGKTAVIVACENREKKAVDSVNFSNIEEFVNRHLLPRQRVRTDGYPSLNIINKTQQHIPKVTPSERVDEWLPWVHIAIGNLKAFLLGTFHGVTGKFL